MYTLSTVLLTGALLGLAFYVFAIIAPRLNVDNDRLNTIAHQLAKLAETAERGSSATLRAEIADVRTALEMFQAGHRRELGRVWVRLRGGPTFAGETADAATSDTDLAAILALQSAPPARPK